MATTKDLAKLIDREMAPGQGPFLVRICQDAGLLPKVKRGGWRAMEQLTAEHLADFVIAVAGTRAVGERNANGARTAFERFSPLTCEWEKGRHTLREDLSNFLGQYRDKLEIGDGYSFSRMLFINDSQDPKAEILLNQVEPGPDGNPVSRNLDYVIPGNEAEASSLCESVVMGSKLLLELGIMLYEDPAA